jgi:hypothetical protein
MPSRIEIFFSYAHEDQTLMNEVRRQLVLFDRQKVIRKWHDRLIPAEDDWKGQIDRRLRDDRIILLFVSPDFFELDYGFDTEMQEAMRRHTAGCVFRALSQSSLRPCLW